MQWLCGCLGGDPPRRGGQPGREHGRPCLPVYQAGARSCVLGDQGQRQETPKQVRVGKYLHRTTPSVRSSRFSSTEIPRTAAMAKIPRWPHLHSHSRGMGNQYGNSTLLNSQSTHQRAQPSPGLNPPLLGAQSPLCREETEAQSGEQMGHVASQWQS